MSAQVYSLHDDLTRISGPTYGATELSQELISLSGRYICNFKRNAQTTYHIISHARDLCVAINTLIKAVDDNESDWTSYEKYTSAIGPLEECVQPITHVVFRPGTK
jgi:hypothetical protein